MECEETQEGGTGASSDDNLRASAPPERGIHSLIMALPLRSVRTICEFMGLGIGKGKCKAKIKDGKCCTRKTDGKSLFCWQHHLKLKGQRLTHSEWFCIFMELIGGGVRVKKKAKQPLQPIRVRGHRDDRHSMWVFQVLIPEGPGYRKMWRKQGYIEFIECWKERKESVTTRFERSVRWTLPDDMFWIRGEVEWYSRPRALLGDQGYLISRRGMGDNYLSRFSSYGSRPNFTRADWGTIVEI